MADFRFRQLFLGLSLFLATVALGLAVFSIFSPAWQVVELREFRGEHQHGLLLDCVRDQKHVASPGDFYEETPLHCMYKFDTSAQEAIWTGLQFNRDDAAIAEQEHHILSGWHKVLLSLTIGSQLLILVALTSGIFTPCFRPAAIVFTVALFSALLLSLIADGIFFISAMRVDVRFVTGAVGTYEQQIGYAFYLHLLNTALLGASFVLALLTTYKYFTGIRGSSSSANYAPEIPGPPLLEKYASPVRPSPQPQQQYVREYAYHVTSA